MKKNRKLKLMLSTLTTLAVTTPVAVISCGEHKDSAKIETSTMHATEAANADAAGVNQTPYKPTENFIDTKVGLNFKAMEEFEGDIDMSVWRAEPIMKKYDDAFMEQWLNNAKVEGWRSVEDYQKYLQYKIETNGWSGYDRFAGNSIHEENWLSWNFQPGQLLGQTYHAGTGSEIRPTWAGAENEPWNDIDNSLDWYQYDTGAEQFVFDQNNIENAWKRLVHMHRVVPTTTGEILAESSSRKGADGEHAISEVNPAVTRNKYMVDGVLLDNLPRGLHHFFYVTSDRNTFVRDDNGWKVIITDRNKEDSLSKIINPASTENTGEINQDGNFPNQTHRIYNHDPNLFHNEESQIAIKSIDYGGVDSDGNSVYHKNPDHDINELYNGHGTPKNQADQTSFWSGKYSIALKKHTFKSLVDYKYSYFPQEMMDNTTEKFRGRFGEIVSQTFTHPWAGGGYGFQWVEDGHGGHKIYKSLWKMREVVPQWRKVNEQKLIEAGDTDPVSMFKIFANWHHVFPIRDWFVRESDIYKDSGL